jgi:hypothetical protein
MEADKHVFYTITKNLCAWYNGITSSENVSEKVCEYYIQKYVLWNDNVLIVSSQTGASIVKNIYDFNNIMQQILPVEKMLEIEDNLRKIVLAFK